MHNMLRKNIQMLRKNIQSAAQTITVTVKNHLDPFIDAESGRSWNDVLYAST